LVLIKKIIFVVLLHVLPNLKLDMSAVSPHGPGLVKHETVVGAVKHKIRKSNYWQIKHKIMYLYP